MFLYKFVPCEATPELAALTEAFQRCLQQSPTSTMYKPVYRRQDLVDLVVAAAKEGDQARVARIAEFVRDEHIGILLAKLTAEQALADFVAARTGLIEALRGMVSKLQEDDRNGYVPQNTPVRIIAKNNVLAAMKHLETTAKREGEMRARAQQLPQPFYHMTALQEDFTAACEQLAKQR